MSDPVLPWRPEFLRALEMLARISEAMHARGLPRPILVGGGAVEFHSGSAVMTGDFDMASPVQPELEEEMRKAGFVRPSGPGRSLRGWVHPALGFGFEIVASSPMGGTVDAGRIPHVRPPGAAATFRILSVEDMIADRMGQFASGSAPEMREQARVLLRLYPDVDRAYLERRIREETVDEQGIEDIGE